MTGVTTETKLDNPYWDVVQTVPGDELEFQFWGRFSPQSHSRDGDYTQHRWDLVKQYAWAIPSDDAIRWLASHLAGREVVEIGAGLGYWAFLLGQLGVGVTAYDAAPIGTGADNMWCDAAARQWHPVTVGDETMAARHPDAALFLCWPCYGTPAAVDALRAYQGDTLIYCGEGWGGCCADGDFFEALDDGWDEVECFDGMTSWSGMRDNLAIYRRKVAS